MRFEKAHFILYVADQKAAAAFYERVLVVEPRLDVPGMTEFDVAGAVLGLMPAAGIKKLLGDALPEPGPATPRAEVYLVVDEPGEYHRRALKAGAKELSPLKRRDWGHEAAYSLDLDGHVLAFACEDV